MNGASPNSADAARLITPTMLVVFLALATIPLWISKIGLYPYLGIEILIWSIYALAFNLVMGTAGLVSFGHGAYFGVGAYASEWSLLSIYILLVAVVSVRTRGLLGKKSLLEA